MMMIYPIKTLSQLPLVLKAFRKEKGLTQAAMAEKLGITQQSYAYFEAKPATATLERLFTILRLLNVGISLEQTAPVSSITSESAAQIADKQLMPPRMITNKGAGASDVKEISVAEPASQSLRYPEATAGKEPKDSTVKASIRTVQELTSKSKPVAVLPKKKESW